MVRKIIHFDLDAFYCAVEELRHPELKGVAFAVGGRPESRGVVASCSYAARQFGVRSAMGMSQAVRLCPELRVLPPDMREYGEVSGQVMGILYSMTPLVEQLSIDEAFLEVTERPEFASELARRLQAEVEKSLGLPSSLGVATNKLVAKIATDVGKAAVQTGDYPRAIQVVPPGKEAEFLAPLPVDALWGVGPRTRERLAEMGIHKVSDVLAGSAEVLARQLGKLGRDLYRQAQGLDERPVVTEREAKSISQETTFAEDVADTETLRRALRHQAGQVGARLRGSGLAARTVILKLRWTDFTTLTRQTTPSHPVKDEEEIYGIASDLLGSNRPEGAAVRLIGVGCSGLIPAVRQMSIFDMAADPEAQAKEDQLNEAVKGLRKRFGADAIRRGSDL
ncbi:MAG: DNA polymerase IV [Caldilineaceae bacterium]|nr:DNA polymerase IV [Caldilineaceae bacterium]